jgi:hypothetical protein
VTKRNNTKISGFSRFIFYCNLLRIRFYIKPLFTVAVGRSICEHFRHIQVSRTYEIQATRESAPFGAKRIVQADSGFDSDSESRNINKEIIPENRLTPIVCTDPPVPATAIRTSTVKQMYI